MRRFRYETILYVCAFLLALAVRVIKLGASPLADSEAAWALQALGVAQGARPLLGSQPAYILMTSVLFYLLGAAAASWREWCQHWLAALWRLHPHCSLIVSSLGLL
jgi:hypothetical protein